MVADKAAGKSYIENMFLRFLPYQFLCSSSRTMLIGETIPSPKEFPESFWLLA